MRRNAHILFTLLPAIACVTWFFVSPASADTLTIREASVSEVQGAFTVILYGGNYLRDFETAAILDPEGHRYAFEPYAPAFDYRVVKGLPAKEALEIAQSFLSRQYGFLRSQLNKIVDDSGKIIGFEMRPLYDPLVFGTSDILDTDYVLKDGKVRAYIRLKPEIWRQLFSGGGDSRDR